IGPDKLGREIRQTLGLPLGGTQVENQVLAFDITQLNQPLLYNHGIRAGNKGEVSDAGELCRLLGSRGERPSCRRAADERDERAAFHSMTSSASSTKGSRTERPSALAVLRLTTNSINEPGDAQDVVCDIGLLFVDRAYGADIGDPMPPR